MTNKSRALLQVHFAVLILGFSGLFGKLVTVPVFILILGRSLFSVISLLGIIKYMKYDIKLQSKKDFFHLVFIGAILAFHWVTFYHSINISTVAIGLLTFSSFPVFVALIEPYLFKEKLQKIDVIVALIALFGILMVVPSFSLDSHLTQGAIWGLASGISYAVFSLGNKTITKKYPGPIISLYEHSTTTLLLLPSYFILRPSFTNKDIFLIILLGCVFTAFAHTLVISSLKHIKAATSSMIFCIEPLYSIVAAAFILHEIPSPRTLLGGGIIISAVIYSNLHSSEMKSISSLEPSK